MKNLLLIIGMFLSCSFLSAQETTKSIFDIARTGTVAEVKELMKKNPDIINTTNENGFSPLILACYRGNNAVAEFLIDNVKDLNYGSTQGSALTAAVFKSNKQLTQKLLERGANPNLADTNGITPLIYAVQLQDKDLVSILLKNKANKELADKQGKTAFEYAIFSKNHEIINLLKN
ncbi:ankyrin repeat domain-containing protein [Chryseobacterium daecheongense]|uniref:ankyrin repeat domain-containing protein n=1 Tax=Chryseobacterium daecheongense TaxID=192389 RepID=UPI001FD6E796|nr:ankyrin repeat domain-containing protein [Chryseobacterium daecheongense]UOU99820.1 ankyrin repeat domain-containing protein [Chryseobacterium daecheongense]